MDRSERERFVDPTVGKSLQFPHCKMCCRNYLRIVDFSCAAGSIVLDVAISIAVAQHWLDFVENEERERGQHQWHEVEGPNHALVCEVCVVRNSQMPGLTTRVASILSCCFLLFGTERF